MVGPEADTWLTPTTGRRVRDPCQCPPQGLQHEGAQQTLLCLLQGGMSMSVLLRLLQGGMSMSVLLCLLQGGMSMSVLLWLLQGSMSMSVLNCEATQNTSETMWVILLWKGLVLHLQAVLQYSLFCLSWGFGGYVNKTKQKRARKFKQKPRKYSERSVGWPLHQPWWSSTSAPVELWAWLRVRACIAQDACPEAPSGPCQWPALRLEWGSSSLRIQGVFECKADESFSFTDL